MIIIFAIHKNNSFEIFKIWLDRSILLIQNNYVTFKVIARTSQLFATSLSSLFCNIALIMFEFHPVYFEGGGGEMCGPTKLSLNIYI